jgi:hypothetical protein
MTIKEKTKEFKKTTLNYEYCELILTPKITFRWDAAKAPDGKAIEQQAEIWFKTKGTALLGLDGTAFKTIHYKSWKPTGSKLTIEYEGAGPGGAKLTGELTLWNLQGGSGTAEINYSFKTTTFEAHLANSAILKLEIVPKVTTQVKPKCAAIAKWLAENPAGKKIAAQIAEKLPWVAGKAAAGATVLKGMAVGARGLDLPVTLLFKVAEIDADLMLKNAKLADELQFGGQGGGDPVRSTALGFWGAYEAGLRGISARGHKDLWRKGQERRESMLRELQKKFPGATRQQCEALVRERVEKVAPQIYRSRQADFTKAARVALWNSYYAKHKHDPYDAKNKVWDSLNPPIAVFPAEMSTEANNRVKARHS